MMYTSQCMTQCTCETCFTTTRLTDSDYSHDFVTTHLLPVSWVKRPNEVKRYINGPYERPVYNTPTVAVAGRSAAKKLGVKPFEIR